MAASYDEGEIRRQIRAVMTKAKYRSLVAGRKMRAQGDVGGVDFIVRSDEEDEDELFQRWVDYHGR